MLQYGESEKFLVEQAIRERAPLPPFVQDAPTLSPGLALYYLAFWDLQGERGGMGGPIKWTSIQQYADHMQLDEEQREALHYHIRAMDVAQNEYHDKKGKHGNGGAVPAKDESASSSD